MIDKLLLPLNFLDLRSAVNLMNAKWGWINDAHFWRKLNIKQIFTSVKIWVNTPYLQTMDSFFEVHCILPFFMPLILNLFICLVALVVIASSVYINKRIQLSIIDICSKFMCKHLECRPFMNLHNHTLWNATVSAIIAKMWEL